MHASSTAVRSAACSCLLALCCSTGLAQTASTQSGEALAPESTVTTRTTPGNPAAAQPVSAEERNDIAELLRASGAINIARTFSVNLTLQISEMLKKSRPDISASVFDLIGDEVNKVVSASLESKGGLVDLYVQLYHKYFTRDEIKQLTVFYNSPLGRKMQSVSPTLLKDSIAVGQRWGQMISPLIQQRVRERLQQSGVIM